MASSDTTTPDDRPRLRVGDHVRDREIPTQTLLVLEHTESEEGATQADGSAD